MTFSICKKQKKKCASMPLSKKYFIYYCRISVSEGLNTTLSHSQLKLEKYDKKYIRNVDFVVA